MRAQIDSRYVRSIILMLILFLSGGITAVRAQGAGPRALRGTLTVIGEGMSSPDDVAVAADYPR